MPTPTAPLPAGLEQLLDQLAQRIAHHLQAHQPAREPVEEPPPWLNLTSAAAYLDWPKQRLYKLTASGAIPHYKHDGRLLFNKHELDHWLLAFAQGDRTTGTGSARARRATVVDKQDNTDARP
jgi:excisionase family DNA binding protein